MLPWVRSVAMRMERNQWIPEILRRSNRQDLVTLQTLNATMTLINSCSSFEDMNWVEVLLPCWEHVLWGDLLPQVPLWTRTCFCLDKTKVTGVKVSNSRGQKTFGWFQTLPVNPLGLVRASGFPHLNHALLIYSHCMPYFFSIALIMT